MKRENRVKTPLGTVTTYDLLSAPQNLSTSILEAFRNLSKDGKGVYLTEMEVSHLPLPEPGTVPGYNLLIQFQGTFFSPGY